LKTVESEKELGHSKNVRTVEGTILKNQLVIALGGLLLRLAILAGCNSGGGSGSSGGGDSGVQEGGSLDTTFGPGANFVEKSAAFA
jgi:hypothetical protein